MAKTNRAIIGRAKSGPIMSANANSGTPADNTNQEAPRPITLDGPAGSGKSTVAKILADKLGYIHADSGAMYRTVTLALMEKLSPGASHPEFAEKLAGESPDFRELGCAVALVDGKQANLIQGESVGDRIRTPEVTARIRYIADNRAYREAVNELLRDFARQAPLVVDGRDIGTVVFPDAPCKFFLEASARIRAERRLGEFQEKGHLSQDAGDQESQLKRLEADIERRDAEDRSRPFGALKQAEDAILIDTSGLDINAVVSQLLSYLQIKF